MRHIPVMLALLLALSPGAVAFQAAAPSASVAGDNPSDASAAEPSSDVTSAAQTDAVQSAPNENTTRVMTLGTEPTRSAFDAPSLALGDSLATDYDGVRAQLSIDSLDEQLENTDSTEGKKQILNRYRYRIENRIISLKAKEQEATARFSNGSLSKSEYLRTLGQIDTQVTETQRLIEAMQTRADSVSRSNMDSETATLTGKLVGLDGPVRDHIGKTIRGQESPTQVYVATTESGIVLSTIVGDEYVREIVRLDLRNPSASDETTIRDVGQAIEEQYPWAYNNRARSTIDSKYGTTSVYRMQFEHPQGSLVVYYDGGTESVFNEIQHKQLFGENSLPPGPTVNESAENLTLSVSRTDSGGPLRVKLTNATGAPVQGDISVDGEPVGRTTANGVLWTLGPAEEFQVGATYDGRTVNVTTVPVDASPSSSVTTALVGPA